jgi:antitoxin MazE
MIGNSAGIIINKPILELLKITPEMDIDVETDGERLILTPVRDITRKGKLANVQTRVLAAHEKIFRKLAN